MQTDPRAHVAPPKSLGEYLHGTKRISDAWDAYRSAVIPPAAAEVQVLETRRAFYAAADFILKRLLNESDDEEAGMQLLGGFMRECEEFGEEAREIAQRYERGECDRLGRPLAKSTGRRPKKERRLRGNDARRAPNFGTFNPPKSKKRGKGGKGK